MLDHRSRSDDEQAVLEAWGATIRRHRRWKRLSQRELASQAGISSVFLGEIERGEKDPSSHSLVLIAAALEVPLSELYLRVAALLDQAHRPGPEAQPALPLRTREAASEVLTPVPLSQDETAFDLYKIARLLRSDEQVALLMLAQALSAPRLP